MFCAPYRQITDVTKAVIGAAVIGAVVSGTYHPSERQIKPKEKKSTAKHVLVVEQLEPRVLFSADIFSAVETGIGIADINETEHKTALIPPPWESKPAYAAVPAEPEVSNILGSGTTVPNDFDTLPATELIFVDYRTPDAQQLLSGIKNSSSGNIHYEIVALNADDNGIELITSTLQQFQSVDAVHIISHGSDGNVLLGNTALNNHTLELQVNSVSSWQNAFTDDADILIYGCDVAATEYGQSLVDALADITGADVAASDDTTGHESLGGDWQFEYTVGSVEAQIALDHTAQARYIAALATVTVDTTIDVVNGDTSSIAALIADDGGDGISLREALLAANADSAADTIQIGPGVHALTISGNLIINTNIELIGAPDGSTIIDASAVNDRVFHVQAGTSAISQLTIEGGVNNASSSGAGILLAGGATLSLDTVVVQNNSGFRGVGISSAGNLTIANSTIANNTASGDGGGLTANGGTVTVTNSTFSGNTASGGGAIHVPSGSGHSFTNVTISGNTANDGGGLKINGSSATLNHVTLTANEGTSGTGGLLRQAGTISVGNSIIAGNTGTGAQDINGGISSFGNNIIGDDPGDSNNGNGYTGSDRLNDSGVNLVATLANNGGDVQTHALLSTSTAIDYAAGSIADDGRGLARTDGSPDSGAYEFGVGSGGGNTAPTFGATLDGNISYTEGSSTAVALDSDVIILDDELSAADDFGGATLTIHRVGGGNSADNFWYVPSSNLQFTAGNVELSGVQKGTHTFGVGTLVLSFDAGTTNADVNEIMQAIGYRTFTDSPPSSVDIAWTFDDGNTGSQGTGGALQASGTSTVNIIAVNDTPTMNFLGPNVTFIENGSPVILDNNVLPFDHELNSANSYDGATLTISRTASADSDDVFSNTGLLGPLIEGGNLVYNGVTMGTVDTASGGELLLQFNTVATDPDVKAIAQSIAYSNSSTAPPASVDLTWTFNDGNTGAQGTGGDLSVSHQMTVDITAIDNVPAIDLNGAFAGIDRFGMYTENSSPVNLAPYGRVNDFGETDIISMTIEAIGFGATNSSDTLVASFTIPAGTPYSNTIFMFGGVNVVVTYDGAETFTFTNQTTDAPIPVAQLQTLLRDIDYANSSDSLLADSIDFEFTLVDATGQTSPLAISTIAVTPSNDAPVLEASGSMTMTVITEDDINNNGDLVSDIILSAGGDKITDVDPGADEGIAIVDSSYSNGNLEYSLDNGLSWTGVGTVSETSALLLRDDDKIRFVPDQENGTTVSMNVRAWDQTTGTAGQKTDVTATGGTTAISDNAEPVTLSVTNVNDAPTIVTNTATVIEGQSLTITPSILQGTDVDDSASNINYTVSNVTNGHFGINGLPGSFVGFTQALINAGSVIFYHDGSETTTASFDYSLADGGEDGASPVTGSVTIAVTPVNDAPDTGGFVETWLADETPLTVTGAATFHANAGHQTAQIDFDGQLYYHGIGVHPSSSVAVVEYDVNGATSFTATAGLNDTLNSGATVIFRAYLDGVEVFNSGNITHGTTPVPVAIDTTGSAVLRLEIDKENSTAGDHAVWADAMLTGGNAQPTTISLAESASNGAFVGTYQGNDKDINDTLTYTLEDSANGRFAIDAASGVITVADQSQLDFEQPSSHNVTIRVDDGTTYIDHQVTIELTDVNEFPSGTDNTITIVEDTQHIFTASDFGFSDPDGDNLESVFIASLPTAGTLELDGTTLTTTTIVPASDFPKLSYTPYANTHGIALDSIEFQVRDNRKEFSANTNTLTFDVLPVNDAPTLSGIEALPATYTEGAAAVGVTGNLSLGDIDDANIESATVYISNGFIAAEDELVFTAQPGISGSYDNTTGVLTFSGSASVADYQAVLRSVGYINNSGNPTLQTRDVSFQINDGDLNSNVLIREINVVAVNNAPVLSGIEPNPAAYIENALPLIVTGTTNTSDGDDTHMESATVVISANFDANNDILGFIDQNGITGTFDPNTGVLDLSGTATLSEYQTALQSITYANTSENPSDLTRTVSFEISDGDDGSNTITRNINFTAVNDAPVISTIEALPANYTENGAPIGITGNLSVADVDDSNIESATVSISNNFAAGQDELLFNDQFGITGIYDAATGVLSLTGSASVAAYETAIRDITYHNTSDNPSDLTRTVSININDGDLNSNTLSRDINFAGVNDAPTLSGIETAATTYTENNTPLVITGSTVVGDLDDTNIESATGAITGNFATAEDQLLFTDQPGITGSYDSATGVMTLNGSATLTQYQTAIQSIAYQNSSDNPSDLTRTVSFEIYDGDDYSNIVTRDINFTAVNDAPVLSTIEALPANYTENGAPIGITGNLSVADVDDTSIESAIVFISNNFVAGQDELLFTDQFGITGSFDSVTGILVLNGSATVAQYETAIQSITYQNSSDNPSDLIRTVSIEIFDGDALSNEVTRDINFTAVNDAPVISTIEGLPANYTENGAPVGITGNLSVADVDDTLIETATVSISNNFVSGQDELLFTDQLGIAGSFDTTTGVLTLSGSATLADYQAAIRSVTYTNTSDNPSTSTRTVSITINDGNLNSNTLGRDINFTSVNDAPTLSGIESTAAPYTENDAPLTITGSTVVGDLDDTNIESANITITGNFETGEDQLLFADQLGITGSYDPVTGAMTLVGSATLDDYQTAIQSIAFQNTSDDPSDLTRTVSFVINDGDDNSNIVTTDINFTAINDAPVISTIEALPANYTENGAPVGITGNLSVADVDDTNIESAAVYISNNFAAGQDELLFSDQLGITGTYVPTTGVLTLSGSATLADYQTAIRAVTYSNTSDNPSTLTRTVSVSVNDGDLNSNTLSRDINFAGVNDAPTLTGIETTAASYTENDVPLVITGTTLAGDIDDTNIESANIAITGNFATGEDELIFTDQFGITGVFDSVTGIMTLSGTATLADYQAAIQSIAYQNTSEDPSNLTRTVSFEINDGDDYSNAVTRNIEFTAVNDAPVISTIEALPANYTENGSPIGVTGNLSVADVDDTTIESAAISISNNFAAGQDELLFNDQFGITGIYDAATGVLSLTGSASAAAYEAAIRDITYHNTSDNPSDLTRTVSININDGDLNSNTLSRDINFAGVNDAPTLSGIETTPTSYTENDAPLVITGSTLVGDIDDTNIESATISITGNFVTGVDELVFTNQSGITGSYDSANGVMTLTGSATLVDYQAAIQSIAYENTSENPSDLTRTVSFEINDGDDSSNTVTRDISFTSVNDAPVISTIEALPANYTENGAPVGITGNLSVADVDDSFIESAIISINNNFAAGQDELLFTNQSGITGTYDATTGVLTLSGSATVADYQAAIRSVTYINTSDNPSTSLRTVSIVINDGDLSSNTLSRDINFNGVNDAPTLSGMETTVVSYTENDAPLIITGTTLIGDIDDTNIESASIAITGNFATGEDELIFANQLGITGVFDSATGIITLTGSATLTDYQAAIQSIAYQNTSEDPSNLTRTVSFEINDGDDNSNTVTRDINFTAINDSPVISNIEALPANYTENGAPTGITGNLSVADVDDTFIESAIVFISNNFVAGQDELLFTDQFGITGSFDSVTGILVLNGSATLVQYETAIHSIAYQNNSDNPSDLTRTVSIEIFDGDDISNVVTRDIDFTSVNDAPAISTIEALPANYSENGAPIGITGNLSAADVDDTFIETATVSISNNFVSGQDELLFTDQLGITGSFDTTSGVLTLSGTATVADYQAAIRSVTYTNTSDNPSTSTRTVSITINDGNLNSNTLGRDINFTSVNDAPTLSGIESTAASYTENDAPLPITDSTVVGDLDDTNIENATASITGNFVTAEDELLFTDQLGITGTYDSTNGTMTLNGSATLAQYQTAIQSIAYQNSSDNPSDLTRTVSFEINDGDDNSNVVTREISFAAVNDAPVISTIEGLPANYTENGAPVGITGNLSLADIDDIFLESATVYISNNFAAGQDELLFSDQLSIAGSYDPTSGVLSLIGNATVADYQTAIRDITYNNSSDNPSTLTRTVSINVNDGDMNSNTLSRDINFTGINDAPTLSGVETTATSYTENDAPLLITGSTVVGDLDDTNIESATIAITGNFATAEDELLFTDQLGISGSYDSTTGVMTLNGSATLAQYQTAIQSIAYQNASDNPSDLTRTVSFEINDGDDNSNVVTRDINFTAVNDAPVLSTIEALPAFYTENGTPIGVTGNLTLSDVDDTSIETATIAISGNFAPAEDELIFNDQLGITGLYDSTTGVLSLNGTASVADYQAAIRSIAYNNNSENPSTQTRTVSYTINDGNYNSNILTRDIELTAVNDAPVLSTIEAFSATYIENSSPILITDTISLADSDDTLLEGASVSIVGNFEPSEDVLAFANTPEINGIFDATAGLLTLTGPATIADYETALQSITYQDTSDNPSVAERTIAFSVTDGEIHSNTLFRSINIIPANDAPALSAVEPELVTFNENDTGSFVTSAITVNDIDDTFIQSATVAITANYSQGFDQLVFNNQSGISGDFDATSGILTLSGNATLVNYQNALRDVQFINNSDYPSTATRTIEFTVTDNFADSNAVTRQLTINPDNDAPLITSLETSALPFTENAPALAVSDSLTLDDLDDSNLESATVAISSNFVPGQDYLTFNNFGGLSGISATYNDQSGVLVLSGSASIADYQAALRSVAYSNISNNPELLTRTIDFLVNDGDLTSNVASRDVQITPVNDRPTLTSVESDSVVYTENQLPVAVTDSITITDLDNTTLENATVAISANFQADQDQLQFANTANIIGTFDAINGALYLTGTASLAEYQQAVRSVTYQNLSDNPSTLPRTLEFSVADTTSDSVVATRSLQVQSVNDAPTANDITIELLEDTAYTLTIADLGFNDPLDYNAFAGIFIQNLPSQGMLTVYGNAAVIGQYVSGSDINAGALLFTPQANASGENYDRFEFQVVDDGGTLLDGIDRSVTNNQVSFNVTNVNDEPNGTDAVVSITEDTPYVLSRSDFGFTDFIDADQFSAITIVQLPASGTLTLNGTQVAQNTIIDVTSIDAGELQYSPQVNASGVGYNGFSFKVHDDGGSNNNGQPIDQTENFISFNITEINDSPLLITVDTTVDEGSENTLTTEMLTAIDSDDPRPQDLTFIINSLPFNGMLTINGAPATAGVEFTLEQLQQNQLRYTHDGSETAIDYFDIKVSDGGEDGSIAATGRFTLLINEVIDPPPVIDNESVLIEVGGEFNSLNGSQLVSGQNTLAAELVQSNPLLLVSIDTPPEQGTVTIEPDGTFTYVHNGSNILQDSFSYRVTNEDGIYSVATVSVNVEPPFESALDTAIIPITDTALPERVGPESEVEQIEEAETNEETEEDNATNAGSETAHNQLSIDSESLAILPASAESSFTTTEELITQTIETYDFDKNELIFHAQRELEQLGVRQHNNVDYTQLNQNYASLNTTNFNILIELDTNTAHEAISNRQFLDGLKRLDDDFENTQESSTIRQRFATDVGIGASLGATAGILAWVLRGGVLFASVMAYTPLWSSIDPVRVLTTNRTDDELSANDDEVEQYFSEK